MWTDDDGHGFLHTRVPWGEVKNFWEDFTNSQKKFNSFENEWDLCVKFDPKARTQEDIKHELEYFGEAPNSDNFSSQPPLLPLADNHYVELDPMARTHEDIKHSGEAPNSDHFSSQPTLLCLPEDHWHNDIVHNFAPDDEPMTTNDVNRDPLDDYMYFRFGFTSPPIEQSSQPSSKEWREIRVALADQMSPVSGKYQAAIADFIMALLTGRSLSPESWDLKNPDLLLLQEWHCQHFVDVKTFSGETFYIIWPHFAAPNERWLFTMQSDTAVLQCLRRELSSSLDIARVCLSKGIPFSTRIQGTPGSIPFHPRHAHSASHRSPTIGLGQHPPGYKPDALDYTLYKDVS